jgi:hypothetical protein
MPSPSPTTAAVSLDYQRPSSVAPIVFRDGSDLVVRGGSDFSSHCVCCARPAAGKPVQLRCIDLMIAGPIIGSLIAVGFAFHRPRLSVSSASADHQFFWLRHAGPDFLAAYPPLPRS